MVRGLGPLLLVALVTAACGDDDSEPQGQAAPPPDPNVLFDRSASYSGARASFDLPVQAGDRLSLELTSSAFDPVLEATLPGGSKLTNDDWNGARDEARLSLVVPQAGALKLSVGSFQPNAQGAYRLMVRRVADASATTPATLLEPGSPHVGELAPGDAVLPSGAFSDHFVVNGRAGASLSLRIEATGDAIPLAIVIDPDGRTLSATSSGEYAIGLPGTHRVQLIAPRAGERAGYRITLRSAEPRSQATLSRSHHQLPSADATTPIRIGESTSGALEATDATLPSGERADLYALRAEADRPIRVELSSSAFDAYLLIVGPDGRHWENDDSGGALDAAIDLESPRAGSYTVVATTFRAGMSGAYELKISPAERNASAQAPAAERDATRHAGSLDEGDETLSSGEAVDTFPMTFHRGQHVRLEARSSSFDTYLIVRAPSGHQQDNDDTEGTNAALDFVATESGTHQVQVTSYRAGERGAYELVVQATASTPPTPSTTPAAATASSTLAGESEAEGAGTPSIAQPSAAGAIADPSGLGSPDATIRGSLAAGDQALPSGEWVDHHTRRFEAGAPVRIRLESDAFDPYLIIRAPSGQQSDNDDLSTTTRNAGIDLPAAESGEYEILVTSYEPGEVGDYALSFSAGAATPRAGNDSEHGGRVFGLFAGISDYPDGVGDLPECANDAIKLAEALRTANLLDPGRQVLLTDAEATSTNLRRGFRQLAAQMGPSDVFLFFYSGHGAQTEGTQDARELDGRDEYLVLHDGPLLDDDLGTLFDGVRAGTSVMALDACFSGGFAKDVITRQGRVGLFSSEEDVLSAVAGQFQAGGYLSHFLRTAVSGEADRGPRDRVLTVGELTHYLYTQFGRHATDVQLQGAYQHLVIDRGAVRVDHVLWSYHDAR